MNSTQLATINRASEVIAENAARRFAAGNSYADSIKGALAEFAARWPKLAGAVALHLGVTA